MDTDCKLRLCQWTAAFGGGGDSTYTVHGVQEGQVSASPSFFIHDGVQLESSTV